MNFFCQHSTEIIEQIFSGSSVNDFATKLMRKGLNKQEALDRARIINDKLTNGTSTRHKAIKNIKEAVADLQRNTAIDTRSKQAMQLMSDLRAGRFVNLDTLNVGAVVSKKLNIPSLHPKHAQKIVDVSNHLAKLMKTYDGNAAVIRRASAHLEKVIADSVDSRWLAQTDTFTIFNLLGNTTTTMRNIFGNIAEFAGVEASHTIKRIVRGDIKGLFRHYALIGSLIKGSSAESMSRVLRGEALHAVSGSKDTYLGTAYKGVANVDFKRNQLADLKGSGKKFEETVAQGRLAWEHVINTLDGTNRTLLEVPDIVFRDISYLSSVTDQLLDSKLYRDVWSKDPKLNFETVVKNREDLIKWIDTMDKKFGLDNREPVPPAHSREWLKIKEVAGFESAEAVFQQDSVLSNMASSMVKDKILSSNNAVSIGMYKFAAGTIMKFPKIVTNVALSAIKTDLLLGSAFYLGQAIVGRSGKESTEFLLQRMKRGFVKSVLVGSGGIGAAGAMASAMGLMKLDENNDMKFVINGVSYEQSVWMAGFKALNIGARIHQHVTNGSYRDAINESGYHSDGAFYSVFESMKKAWVEEWASGNRLGKQLSAFPAVGGMIKSMEYLGLDQKYDKNDTEGNAIMNLLAGVSAFAISGAAQYIPALSIQRQMAVSADEYQRDIRGANSFETQMNMVKSALPSHRESLDIKKNKLQQDMKAVHHDNMPAKLLQNFLIPSSAKTYMLDDPKILELHELKKAGLISKDSLSYVPRSDSEMFKILQHQYGYKLTDQDKKVYQNLYAERYVEVWDWARNHIGFENYDSLTTEEKAELHKEIHKHVTDTYSNAMFYQLVANEYENGDRQ